MVSVDVSPQDRVSMSLPVCGIDSACQKSDGDFEEISLIQRPERRCNISQREIDRSIDIV